jgi:cobalt/nickel transport system permease protein
VRALGLNIINMGFVPAFLGFGLFTLLRRLLPTSRVGVLASSALGALVSVVLASIAFTVEYAIGGNGAAPVGAVAVAMIGIHVLIGIGEAVITTLTVSAVLASRPDLVYGARDLPRPAPAPWGAAA